MKKHIVGCLLFFSIIGVAHAQPTILQCKTSGGAQGSCPQPINQSYIPASIPASKIGPGTVSDTVFGYLAGATSSIQAQINAIIAGMIALSNTTPAAIGTAAVGVGTTAARADHVHSLPNAGTAGTYANPSSITTDAHGIVTAVVAGSTPAVATRSIATGTGLLGGGNLTADRTLTIDSTVVTLTGAQTLTNKTLTSPTISSPTFSGTEGGTRTIGGTPTLGVNVAGGGFKFTGLGAPTPGSSDSATAAYAEAQKTGSSVCFAVNVSVTSWVIAGYLGIAGDAPSTSSTSIVPWSVPAAGKIKNLSVYGHNNIGTNSSIIVVRDNSPSNTVPVFLSTTLTCVVSSGTHICVDSNSAHAVNVAQQDIVTIFNNDATWSSPGGISVCFQYTPN